MLGMAGCSAGARGRGLAADQPARRLYRGCRPSAIAQLTWRLLPSLSGSPNRADCLGLTAASRRSTRSRRCRSCRRSVAGAGGRGGGGGGRVHHHIAGIAGEAVSISAITRWELALTGTEDLRNTWPFPQKMFCTSIRGSLMKFCLLWIRWGMQHIQRCPFRCLVKMC